MTNNERRRQQNIADARHRVAWYEKQVADHNSSIKLLKRRRKKAELADAVHYSQANCYNCRNLVPVGVLGRQDVELPDKTVCASFEVVDPTSSRQVAMQAATRVAPDVQCRLLPWGERKYSNELMRPRKSILVHSFHNVLENYRAFLDRNIETLRKTNRAYRKNIKEQQKLISRLERLKSGKTSD